MDVDMSVEEIRARFDPEWVRLSDPAKLAL